jgi:hypothetical protein
MKEISYMDFPQHGEIFYFCGQALVHKTEYHYFKKLSKLVFFGVRDRIKKHHLSLSSMKVVIIA